MPDEPDKTESQEQPASGPDHDWLLTAFVEYANRKGGGGLALTLLVGGAIVSGRLVGLPEYLEGLGQDLDDGAEAAGAQVEEGQDTVGGFFRRLAEEAREAIADEDAKQDDDVPPPVFIHLSDARVFAPGGGPVPTNRGVWWRGRLSQVDGFSLGELTVEY